MENNEIITDIVENAKLFSSLDEDFINKIILIVKNWAELCENNEIQPSELFQIVEQALDILDSYDAETGDRLVDLEKAVQISINKVMFGNELDNDQIHIK